MGLRDRVRNWLNYSTISISSPAFADMIHFGLGAAGSGGAYAALENPAFNRGVQILSGTIASLPLRTYHLAPPEPGSLRPQQEPSSSFMDQWPAGVGRMSPFNWKEQVVLHLVTAGEVGLPHIHSGFGELVGLVPFGRDAYIPRWEDGHKVFKVTLSDGTQKDFGDSCENAIEGRCMTQILGPSLDGLRGLSPQWLFRNGIAMAQAQDTAARRTMTNGMHASGLVTSKGGTLTYEEAESIKKQIKESMLGPEHTGEILVTNRDLEFTPWVQTNDQAQFIEQREFTVHEVARMLGVPAHLLYSTSPEQSFASGLAEQVAGFARFTLMPITSRIEEAISPVIGPSTKFVEFDYKGLLQGTPESEINLLLAQLKAQVLSKEEFREFAGLGPMDPSDTFAEPPQAPPAASNGNGRATNIPAARTT